MRPIAPSTVGVIVSNDHVGDGLMKLPFVRALREAFPDARITWITTRGPTVYEDLLADVVSGCIDDFARLPELADRRVRDLLRPAHIECRFDLLIDTRGRWKQAATARRVPHRWFLSPAARYALSDRRPASRPVHVVERLVTLVEAACGRALRRDGRIVPGPGARALAAAVTEGLRAPLGIAPGAGDRKKVWPLDRFVAFARAETALGRQPVFLLGPAEVEHEAALHDAVPGACFALQSARYREQGGAGVEDTIALGECMVASISNDSGTGHMLATSGRPLLSLFGPTSARKLAPLTGDVHTLETRDVGGGDDMRALAVETVVESFEPVFARGAAYRGPRDAPGTAGAGAG